MSHDLLILEVHYRIHNIWPMVSLSSEIIPSPYFHCISLRLGLGLQRSVPYWFLITIL